MKILFIEDNDIKYRKVTKWLEESMPSLEIVRARSYHSGVCLALKGDFERIILDMTLPAYDEQSGALSQDPQTFEGENILRELVRRNVLSRVIILTQYTTFPRGDSVLSFEQLKIDLMKRFEGTLYGCVYLDSRKSGWKIEIEHFLNKK